MVVSRALAFPAFILAFGAVVVTAQSQQTPQQGARAPQPPRLRLDQSRLSRRSQSAAAVHVLCGRGQSRVSAASMDKHSQRRGELHVDGQRDRQPSSQRDHRGDVLGAVEPSRHGNRHQGVGARWCNAAGWQPSGCRRTRHRGLSTAVCSRGCRSTSLSIQVVCTRSDADTACGRHACRRDESHGWAHRWHEHLLFLPGTDAVAAPTAAVPTVTPPTERCRETLSRFSPAGCWRMHLESSTRRLAPSAHRTEAVDSASKPRIRSGVRQAEHLPRRGEGARAFSRAVDSAPRT